MATDDGYNGWTNYETWAVKLWIDNDQGSYNYWRERAQEARDEGADHMNVPKIWTADEAARFTLADQLKEWHEENMPGMPHSPGVYTDLLTSALSEVNWTEIAANLLSEE